MAGRIPDDTIQEIRDRVSIVEVISSYVSLKRAGRNHLGLCPFHHEKTPSFTVSEERGLFHCFGCGAGGTVFTFLMRLERLEFPEAVELVARRAGIALPERQADSRESAEREKIEKINAWAAKRFAEALAGRLGEPGRDYLRRRGISEETLRAFNLGLAPGGDTLTRALAGRADASAAAERAGLLLRRDRGGLYDRFRDRLMFPIADGRGRVVGFGGRILGDGQPKYLNSPESPIFRKGELLYGLPQARAAIREQDCAVVVEGYMDALALVQHGIAPVVATLGTALTGAHLRQLRRLASRIVVFFDGDRAGRAAATRAFAVCAEAECWASGAFLPDGEDPDSFVRSRGAEEVRQLLADAVPLSDFYFQEMRAGLTAPVAEKARAASEVARVLGLIRSPIERDLLTRRAAALLGVGEDALRAAAGRPAAAPPPRPEPEPAAPQPLRLEPVAEVVLLEAMAADRPTAAWITAQGTIERFRNPELARCAALLAGAWEDGEEAVSRALEGMPQALSERLSGAALRGDGTADWHRTARDCAGRIEEEARRRVAENTLEKLRQAATLGDEERERELLQRKQEELEQRRRGAGPG